MDYIANYDKITARIKELRNEKNMTQDMLADACDVTRQTVSKWEQGKSIPDMEGFFNLCRIFDCELGYLLGEEGYSRNGRIVADIKKQTGLSDKAIKRLMNVMESNAADSGVKRVLEDCNPSTEDRMPVLFSRPLQLAQFFLESENTVSLQRAIEDYLHFEQDRNALKDIVDLSLFEYVDPLNADVELLHFDIYIMILEKRIPIINTTLFGIPLKEAEDSLLNTFFIEEFYSLRNDLKKITEIKRDYELRDLTPDEELAFRYYCSHDVIEILRDTNGSIHKFVLNEHLWHFVNEYLEYENTHSPGDGFWYIEGVKDE